MNLALVLVPLTLAGVMFATPSQKWRPRLLTLALLIQLLLVVTALRQNTVTAEIPQESFAAATADSTTIAGELKKVLVLDPLGRVFLGFISLMFFLCSLYAPGYLALFPERPNRMICSAILISVSMMTLVVLSHHLGVMWVAMEATTLATAPSLYFNHNPRSLEATWKYLLVCSVGIALALFGSFFLAYASLVSGLETTLLFDDLVLEAPHFNPDSLPWVHAAFVLLLVGYGTKMGLAPMHTWKPDAYGEAPGMTGALLAGGMTSCAFLALLRVYRICEATTEGELFNRMLIFIGLFSMAVGAVFMARQRDFKRMLAYSSVEHMGILVFGIGIGGPAVFGALLHMINNGLTKGIMFLSAGNIHRAYESKYTKDVTGAIRRIPFSGAMFFAGFLAVTGSPPFGPFVSEFTIVSAAFQRQQYFEGGLFLLLLFTVFIGMGSTVMGIVFGKPSEACQSTSFRDTVGTSLPIVIFMTLVLCLGLFIPPWLREMLNDAAATLNTRSPV